MSELSASASFEPNRPKSNRRFRVPSNPWLPYIGDCKALENYLKSKNGVIWFLPKYLSGMLRGISQVAFANNPLAGLVILIALFWSNVFVGLAAIVSATTAILTALLMRQDPASIAAGLTTYNAVLVGTVTSSLWTPLYGEELGIKLWSFIILGSALSVFITSSVANIFASLKIPLPALTLPFNLVVLLIFICLMPKTNVVQNPENETEPVALRLYQQQMGGHNHNHLDNHNGLIKEGDNVRDENISLEKSILSRNRRKAEDLSSNPTTDIDEGDENGESSKGERLNWGKILRGIIVSSGQVYGVHDEIGSVLIYIGLLIYSPILFMMSTFGAILGTICGIFFTPAPYHAIYNGIWGYNGILSAASVGGFFIVLTCHSFFNAMVNVIFTALIQQAMLIAFAPLNLPVFTFPFVFSTLLFLSVTTAGNHLPRVDSITFPEMHRYYYREAGRLKREGRAGKHSSIVGDEIAEEKELVLTDVKVISEDVKAQVENVGDVSDNDNDDDGNEKAKEEET